jgi:hypothetical protein
VKDTGDSWKQHIWTKISIEERSKFEYNSTTWQKSRKRKVTIENEYIVVFLVFIMVGKSAYRGACEAGLFFVLGQLTT